MTTSAERTGDEMFNTAIGLAIMTGGRLGGRSGSYIPDPETADDRRIALEQATIDFHNHRISGAWVSSDCVPYHWAACYRRYIAMIYQQEWNLDVEPIVKELHLRAALGHPVREWKLDAPREKDNA